MDALKIPEEHKGYIKYYLDLPDDIKKKIVDEIKSSELGIMPSVLVDKLHEEVGLPKGRIHDVITVLFSLISTQQKLRLDDSQFIDVLRETYSKLNSEAFSEEEFIKGLSFLLSARGENSTATDRIVEVLTDNQNIFISTSINSDLRPVFLNDDETVKNAVVIHNLKISYRSNGKNRLMYFALDSDDLQLLKDAIDLAEKRSKIIESIAKVSIITLK